MADGIKYRVIRPYVHIAIWTIYISIFCIPNMLKYDWPWDLYFPIHSAVLIATFYFNHFYLTPRFFKKEAYGTYFILLCCTYVAGILAILSVITAISYSPVPVNLPIKKVYLGSMITYTIEFSLLSLIKMAKEWRGKYEVTKKSQIEHMQAELKLLRSQLDPHFIFNTLNNIYLLVLSASPKASDSIIMLSDLLNYILYESNEEKVSIDKEIEFIESYISLQKLRVDPSQQIIFEIHGERKGMVPPLIIFNFVENAFKHAQHNEIEEKFYIFIKIKIDPTHLVLDVKNWKKHDNIKSTRPRSGIGLDNTVKRLSLIYSDMYTLEIENSDKSYSVQLKIPVHEHTMPAN